jgi:hypothetical protein
MLKLDRPVSNGAAARGAAQQAGGDGARRGALA